MKYGLIGEKLGHSFSREIHNELGSAPYELKEIARQELPAFLAARDFCAVNVTIPYKQEVIPHLDHVSEAARAIGAVNTIVNRNGVLYGYNTDFFGMRALIVRNLPDLQGKKVLILGTGGTSRTAAAVAADLGAGCVLRLSRTPGKTDPLPGVATVSYDEAKKQHWDADIIINTTPCGMFPNRNACPVDPTDYPNLCGVADAIYNPLRSRLVLAAQARGIPAVGGLYMLVAQGVKASELFRDCQIPEQEMLRVYRKLLSEKENPVLIGMPGCGKSTVGRKIAAQLNMDFIDTDEEIVRQAGRPIPEIFREEGESGFRKREAAVIDSLALRSHTVIATGGGAVLKEENRSALRANGRLFFLDRSPALLTATADRPLSSDRESLMRRYRERYPLYTAEADTVIAADGSIDEVANLVIGEIKK